MFFDVDVFFGLSMHSRSAFSRCPQPWPVWFEEEDAQQPVFRKEKFISTSGGKTRVVGRVVVHLLNMAVIGPIQGFWSCCLGFLIRRCDTDCSRIGLVAVDIPLGGAMLVTVVFTQLSLAKSCG